MLLVMVMDFVVKADVCAHLNIITKRTALFMDVSSSCKWFCSKEPHLHWGGYFELFMQKKSWVYKLP